MVAATKPKTIEDMAAATLKRLETKDPGLKALLKKAYAYAVFPSVGKASLVIGGAYGKGAVYERGKFVGYATIGQTTVGVQIGGDTFAEIIVFENKEAFERLKRGKMSFAADASAVLVKSGAAAGKGFGNGTSAFVYGNGGMLLEAAIGGQKFKFKPGGEGEEEDQAQEQEDEGTRGQARGSSRSGGKQSKARNGSARQQNKGATEEGQEEDQGEDQDQDAEQPGLLSHATEGLRTASTRVTDFVKEHPVAATAIGVGAAGAIALLVWRPWESISSDGAQGEAEDSDDEGGEQATAAEDQYDDEGESDQAEDQYQEEGEEQPQEEEEEDTRYATRGGGSRR